MATTLLQVAQDQDAARLQALQAAQAALAAAARPAGPPPTTTTSNSPTTGKWRAGSTSVDWASIILVVPWVWAIWCWCCSAVFNPA